LTIEECHRPRIEKYITDIVNNHGCKMYKIYANPEHVHFLVSRDPAISLATQGTLKNQVLVATQVMTIDYHFFPTLKKKI
jgi:REP element-mobilizing transposase RayT